MSPDPEGKKSTDYADSALRSDCAADQWRRLYQDNVSRPLVVPTLESNLRNLCNLRILELVLG
jgi:hypothetical protein